MRIHSTFVLAAALLALAACGKSPGERAAEAAIEQATGGKADVDAKTGKVEIKGDDGSKMTISGGADAKLPATFPKDMYLPADYKVLSVMEMPNAMVVQLDAKGELAALADAAGKKMASEGWKQSLSMQQSSEQRVTMYEKDKRSATVSLNDDEEPGVKVSLQLASSQ